MSEASLITPSEPAAEAPATQTTSTPGSPLPSTPVASISTEGDPPSPTFQGLLGEDGTSFRPDADWKPLMANLGVEKYAESFKKYKTPEELLRGAANLQSLVGSAPGIQIPKADSPEHVVKAYREATGVPDAVAGYELAMPDDLPEGVSINDASLDRAREIAHKHHIPAAALNELVGLQLETMLETASSSTEQANVSATAQRDANLAELQGEWKGDFEKNLSLARRVAISRDVQDGDPILGTPSGIKLLVELGGLVREDTLPINQADHTQSTVSDFEDMVKNSNHPNHHRYHNEPGYARSVHDQMNRRSS